MKKILFYVKMGIFGFLQKKYPLFHNILGSSPEYRKIYPGKNLPLSN